MRRFLSRINVLFIVLGFLLLSLPFLDRPFHIDDEVTLSLAERISNAGYFQVFDEPVEAFGLKKFHLKSTHPLLLPWLISILDRAGYPLTELSLHIFWSLFSAGSIAFFFLLSKEWNVSPVSTTVLLILSPAFFLSSQSVMNDIPSLCGMLGTIYYCTRIEKNGGQPPLLFGVWLFHFLALFTSYLSLLLPLLLFFLFSSQRLIKTIVVSIVPWSVLSVFSVIEILPPGHPQIFAAVKDIFTDQSAGILINRVHNLLYGITALGLTGPIFFGPSLVTTRKLRAWFILAGCVTTITGLVFYGHSLSAINIILYVAGTLNGVSVLFLAGRRIVVPVNPSDRITGTWFLVAWVLPIVILPFNAVRYMLPALPALVLLVGRELESALRKLYFRVSLVIFAVAVSYTVAFSDYFFARSIPTLLNSVPVPTDRVVWFTGEWGFRHYAEKKGFRYLLRNDSRLKPGDVVLFPDNSCPIPQQFITKIETRTEIALTSRLPVRTMNFSSGAGFYSNWNGRLPLPFSFSLSPLEKLTISIVK